MYSPHIGLWHAILGWLLLLVFEAVLVAVIMLPVFTYVKQRYVACVLHIGTQLGMGHVVWQHIIVVPCASCPPTYTAYCICLHEWGSITQGLGRVWRMLGWKQMMCLHAMRGCSSQYRMTMTYWLMMMNPCTTITMCPPRTLKGLLHRMGERKRGEGAMGKRHFLLDDLNKWCDNNAVLILIDCTDR